MRYRHRFPSKKIEADYVLVHGLSGRIKSKTAGHISIDEVDGTGGEIIAEHLRNLRRAARALTSRTTGPVFNMRPNALLIGSKFVARLHSPTSRAWREEDSLFPSEKGALTVGANLTESEFGKKRNW